MISRDSVHVVGESVGIPPSKIPDTVADVVGKEVEDRLRHLVADARKFMTHSNRSTLTTDDIALALRLRTSEVLHGYHFSDPMSFRRAHAADDVFFVEDAPLKLDHVVNANLPKGPVEPTFSVHWLAINGIQPLIPQNPSQQALAQAEQAAQAHRDSNSGLPPQKKLRADRAEQQIKPLVKHVLSREQQLYYEHVTAAIKSSDSINQEASFQSLANDEGLHQLLPYFSQFIAEEVLQALQAKNNLALLRALMRTAQCLLVSPHLHPEPYLHQLMPPILSCLVARRLCESPAEDHWSLRDFCANLVAHVCQTFGAQYPSLQPRVTRTLSRALLDPEKPLTTHYGAIVGLAALGPRVTNALILPQLTLYLTLLQRELATLDNPVKQAEAGRCYGALLHATGALVRHEIGEAVDAVLPTPEVLSTVLAVASSSSSSTAPVTIPSLTDAKSNGAVKDLVLAAKSSASLPIPPLSLDVSSLYDLFGEALLPYAHAALGRTLFSLSSPLTSSVTPSSSASYAISATNRKRQSETTLRSFKTKAGRTLNLPTGPLGGRTPFHGNYAPDCFI